MQPRSFTDYTLIGKYSILVKDGCGKCEILLFKVVNIVKMCTAPKVPVCNTCIIIIIIIAKMFF